MCRVCLREDARRRQRLVDERKRAGVKLPYGRPCDCCGQPLTAPQLDHDHRTGAIRGWICSSDNVSLGHRNDDPAAFLEVAETATMRAAGFVAARRVKELDRAIKNLNRAAYLLKHINQGQSSSSEASSSQTTHRTTDDSEP